MGENGSITTTCIPQKDEHFLKVMKRTRMCFERPDRAISIGRSPLCGGSLLICYMLFLTLMHPLEVITSF